MGEELEESRPTLAGVVPTVRKLAAGAFLFRQNDPTFGVFALDCGRVRLSRSTPEGMTVPMHTVHTPGALFAEASLFSDRYHCNAEVIIESRVLVYSKAALAERLRHDPQALWLFAAELARRVQELRQQHEVRRIRSARQRITAYLHLNCDELGWWRPVGTLKQLAEELGLSHEALYRALTTLERAGVIERSGRGIRLIRQLPGNA